MLVLSPTEEFYLERLGESSKTQDISLNKAKYIFTEALQTIINVFHNENLPENVKTDPINETSTVLYFDGGEYRALFTADAGILGLREAIDYSNRSGINLQTCLLYQIPHHGSRHNINTPILDDLLGHRTNFPPDDMSTLPRTAVACVAQKENNYPRKKVSNAFIRRGVKVTNNRNSFTFRSSNRPMREGWSTITDYNLLSSVEED